MFELTIIYQQSKQPSVFIKQCLSFDSAMEQAKERCYTIGMSKIISISIRLVYVG